MRKFKSTPQKKFLGMVILFVLIPLFLLLYSLLLIDWRPSLDTIVIVAALALLFLYFYRGYRKQSVAPTQPIQEAEEAPEAAPPVAEEEEAFSGEEETPEEKAK